MFWDTIKHFYARLGAIPKVSFAFLGCGLARAWLWWILSLVSYSEAFPSYTGSQGHLLFDLGEVIGFFLLSFLAYRFSPFFKRSPAAVLALALTLFGGFGTVFAVGSPVVGVYAAFLIIGGGVGYALLFLLWLELYGCLTARNMLIAWTGSYFIALAIWGLHQVTEAGAIEAIMCLLPLMSMFMLFKGFYSLPAASLPAKMSHKPSIPWKLIIVLSAFALAFGIGDAAPGQNMFTWISKVGMGIPELLVLLCVLFFSKRFSFRYLVTVASLFIVAGLIGAFFVEGQAVPSFVLMNASSEIYLIMVYAIACIMAHQLGSSAVYLAGLFAGLYKVFLQIGKTLGLVVVEQVHNTAISVPVLALIMVLVTIAATIILVQDRSIVDKFSWKEQSVDPKNASCAKITEEHRLTPKEASVLLLLAKGQDTAQIAEELFLAQSTVRVHTSSIYKKLDIHSRKELDKLLNG